MATRSSSKRTPWTRSNPRKRAGKPSKHLTPAKKAAAKARARRAGRSYPNLVDNMYMASQMASGKKSSRKTSKTTSKTASKPPRKPPRSHPRSHPRLQRTHPEEPEKTLQEIGQDICQASQENIAQAVRARRKQSAKRSARWFDGGRDARRSRAGMVRTSNRASRKRRRT